MAKLQKIVHINADDFSTLVSDGSITIGGVTYTYDSSGSTEYIIDDDSAPAYAETAGYAAVAGTVNFNVADNYAFKTVSSANDNSATFITAAAATVMADSNIDNLTVKGANKWIETLATDTDDTISIAHAASGVTAGSYGPSADSTLTGSSTFTVPYITVDGAGHITACADKTMTLSISNTDEKVKVNASTTTVNTQGYPILTATSVSPTNGSTSESNFFANVGVDSTGIILFNGGGTSSTPYVTFRRGAANDQNEDWMINSSRTSGARSGLSVISSWNGSYNKDICILTRESLDLINADGSTDTMKINLFRDTGANSLRKSWYLYGKAGTGTNLGNTDFKIVCTNNSTSKDGLTIAVNDQYTLSTVSSDVFSASSGFVISGATANTFVMANGGKAYADDTDGTTGKFSIDTTTNNLKLTEIDGGTF